MMPNPWMILGSIAVALSAFFYGHHAGYAQKETEDALEIARLNSVMASQKNEQDAKDADTKQQFETKLSGILSSRPRLYVPVTSNVGCAATTSNNGQARAELDGQTAEDLIRIVADGDRAIIELNSCIDRYNEVKEALHGQRN
jgi:prophage endopeptidase